MNMLQNSIPINDLLRADIPVEGKTVSFKLRIPTTEEVLYLIAPPDERITDYTTFNLETELLGILRRSNGESLDSEKMLAIMNDAEALGAAIVARNRLYETLLEYGQLIARCPHCGGDDTPISLAALTTALQAGPWPITEEDRMVLALPALSAPPSHGARPFQPPCARRIGFQLPSAALGLSSVVRGGALQPISPEAERIARERFEVDEFDPPAGREDWVYSVPGFRAILRLSLSLVKLDELSDEVIQKDVECMPIVDFFFLDCLYWLTHEIDVTRDLHCEVSCERCGGRFLPVA